MHLGMLWNQWWTISLVHTVEPLWKGQECLTKVAKFGPLPGIVLYKSCLFYPSWQATSFERPPFGVAFIEGLHCICIITWGGPHELMIVADKITESGLLWIKYLVVVWSWVVYFKIKIWLFVVHRLASLCWPRSWLTLWWRTITCTCSRSTTRPCRAARSSSAAPRLRTTPPRWWTISWTPSCPCGRNMDSSWRNRRTRCNGLTTQPAPSSGEKDQDMRILFRWFSARLLQYLQCGDATVLH